MRMSFFFLLAKRLPNECIHPAKKKWFSAHHLQCLQQLTTENLHLIHPPAKKNANRYRIQGGILNRQKKIVLGGFTDSLSMICPESVSNSFGFCQDFSIVVTINQKRIPRIYGIGVIFRTVFFVVLFSMKY